MDIKYGTSKKGNSLGLGYEVLGIPNVVNEALSLDRLAFVELSDNEYLIFEALEIREILSLQEISEILNIKNVHKIVKSLIEKRAIIVEEDLK